MKKQFTLLTMLLLGIAVTAQEVIVEWNFPDEGTDSIADGGIAQNLDKPIYTMGGTSNLNFKNGATTKAAQATHWDEGAEVKCWVVELNSENYGSLTLSSKLSSGGNDPGPRDFRVDYRIGENGTWAEVPDSEIITANDWETGVLENLPLPEECSNQPHLYLRWIMISDTSSAGVPVEPGGKLKIDDIIITGTNTSATGKLIDSNKVSVYPNPFQSDIHVQFFGQDIICKIFDFSGKIVFEGKINHNKSIGLKGLPNGMYTLKCFDGKGNLMASRKLLKQN